MRTRIRLAAVCALLFVLQACVESPKPVLAPRPVEAPKPAWVPTPLESPKPGLHSAIEQTVDNCKREVQRALPEDKFDAYVEGSRVKYLATKEAEFQFEKCMSKNGYPISAQ